LLRARNSETKASALGRSGDQRLNTVSRGALLGENQSVWSLVSERDKQRLASLKERHTAPKQPAHSLPNEHPKRGRDNERDCYRKEPEKRERFLAFVACVKRGEFTEFSKSRYCKHRIELKRTAINQENV